MKHEYWPDTSSQPEPLGIFWPQPEIYWPEPESQFGLLDWVAMVISCGVFLGAPIGYVVYGIVDALLFG